jgi:hypothetical protein
VFEKVAFRRNRKTDVNGEGRGAAGWARKGALEGRGEISAQFARVSLFLLAKCCSFSRDLPEIIDHGDDLSKLGIPVLLYQEQFDFSSSTGKLQLAVFAWAAEFERKRINERMRAGLERARMLGKRLGRPRSNVDEEKIRRDYEALKSERKVAQIHGCSDSTIHRILHDSRQFPEEIPPNIPAKFPTKFPSPKRKK